MRKSEGIRDRVRSRQRRALIQDFFQRQGISQPETATFGLPADADFNRILRYETSIQRQLVYAISQLVRLQRSRKGEHVSSDQ